MERWCGGEPEQEVAQGKTAFCGRPRKGLGHREVEP